MVFEEKEQISSNNQHVQHAGEMIDYDRLAMAVKLKLQMSGQSLRLAASEIPGGDRSLLSRSMSGLPLNLNNYVRICRWLRMSLDEFVRKDLPT